ncbi:lysine--tRNA ligase [Levilinea saccharolytica]|uniref:Lysine--tRNA ligase n=1 Tax=Levilinea saccharolytica TaxID=229921 RepID=A0A0P6XCZ2_9CHLR|nr:lysine--tRNA ligase [Levilinea saccharolytica]KPL80740.1 lysyl-tRNA synthetase [Levilinea saccharolytica]GAP17182.1 lysyl-tRNA synthetase, class II [Levilinea saccharolytica]
MELNDLERIRLEKLERMRAAGIEPYPTRVHNTHTIAEAVKQFEAAEKEGTAPAKVILAGRVRSMRLMGKLGFAHAEDGSGRVQLFFRINELGEEAMNTLKEHYDLGDFIEAEGTMMRTRTGEISLQVTAFRMLAKAITPLPAAKDEVVDGEVVRHATLNDPETRYRQRYADLAVNPDVRQIFRTRAGITRAMREFLDGEGFLEVETPILQPIYGGAAARPFITHHNQLKQDLFLRISFELYLKRLLVGMFDRVYEIGRDFRNEGISFKHNPEFTQMEFYAAYLDYLKVMELTENMVAYICDQVLGSRKTTFNGHEIDFTPPWRRVELRQGLIEACGIDIQEHRTDEALFAAMDAKGLKPKPGAPRGKLIDQMIGDFLEPNFIQPTFLYNYPRDISPLAKSMPGDPQTVERFEGFVGGMELCNAFTELNDPLDQEARFLEMGRAYDAEDEESNPLDEDYLRAMRYGMPPCGGFGMGIDRLVMLLTGQRSIREVLLFPHLREREDE